MKKTLILVLTAIMLVTSLGFASLVSADTTDGSAKLEGKGTLTARGDGIAILGGAIAVNITGNGILWVKDTTGNAEIRVTGYGQKEEFADGWIQYSGFNGEAAIKGRRVIVVLTGVDVNLDAKGRGRAILWGHGTYEVNGGQTDGWNTGRDAYVNFTNTAISQRLPG